MGRSSGGASRSSGGSSGGSRSSGGFSGGGRSSGGSQSSSSRSSSSSSSYRSESRREPSSLYSEPRGPRGPRWGGPPPPPRGPRPYRARPYRTRYYRGGGGCSSGCSTILALIIIIVIAWIAINANSKRNYDKPFFGQSSSNYELKSTRKRNPLVGVTKKTDFFNDQIGWIKDKNKLQSGLKDFYNRTGVQPYVLFVKYSQVYWKDRELNTTSADSYLDSVYNETFSDEGHMIFAYFQCDDDSRDEMEGEFRYLLGHSAQTVMDEEAINIFIGFLDEYYYDTNISLEEMISRTFSSTANSIM